MDRRATPWFAFAAGALAVLVLAMGWYVWQGRSQAANAARAAVDAVDVEPPKLPTLPTAPHIPDVPIPRPK